MSAIASVEALLGAGAVESLAPSPGLALLPTAIPGSLEELSELLRLAALEGLVLMPIGLGSKLGHLSPPARVDLLVSTRALSGVVAYEPGDGTLTALAGTPWSELREVARAGGHWLTPDVARPAGATLGGTLVAGRSGFDRLRYGPARHHVLGTRVASADGEITKSGGRLVKNVTGYDLHRLYCGSWGTLGILVEASLRLFPLPRHTAIIRAEFESLPSALDAARAAASNEVRPTTLALHQHDDGGFELLARLDGRPEDVAARQALLTGGLPSPRTLEGDEAVRASDDARDLEPDTAARACLQIVCRPSAVARVVPTALALAREGGTTGSACLHPALATLQLPLDGLEVAAQLALVGELRTELASDSAQVGLHGADWHTLDAAQPDAPPELPGGPAHALMRRLRTALDPDGRFARRPFRDEAPLGGL